MSPSALSSKSNNFADVVVTWVPDSEDHDPHASRNFEVDLVHSPGRLVLNKSLNETMHEILSSLLDSLRRLLRQDIEMEVEYSYRDNMAETAKSFTVSLKINYFGKPEPFEEGYEFRGAYDPSRMGREIWIESETQNTEETIMNALMDSTLKRGG